jgi:hypothetical protein
MLRSTRQLYGKTLGTAEGEIGHVKDFYFNDQHWVVRYVIADTGSWLSGRLVLISPHAFGDFHQDGDCLLVNLTQEQIENSPAIDSHKPVSRQYEEEYYRYYGWPFYWEGCGMRGVAGAPSTSLMPSEQEMDNYKRIGGNCEKARAECQPLRLLSHRQVVLTLLFSVRAEKEKKHSQQEARSDCDYDCIYRPFAEVNYHLGS